MSEEIRISAKNLGEITLPDFCPRCFWVKLHIDKLPFQIFPGIFSSIDSYTKNIVHARWDVNGCIPAYLSGIGTVTGYKKPPHHSKFQILDRESNVRLTGTPDEVLVCEDGSHIIVDYKTAKYTGSQDSLMPMYEVQLNGYALIGEQCGLSPVAGLALVYFEPVTDTGALANDLNHRSDGFALGFKAGIHKLNLNPAIIPPLLAKTREIYEMTNAPERTPGCENCDRLEELISLL